MPTKMKNWNRISKGMDKNTVAVELRVCIVEPDRLSFDPRPGTY
jgi:hypothetical protein